MKLRKGLKIERREGATTRLFDPRSGGVFALNEVGDAIVALLERGTPRAKLLTQLRERFDAPAWVLADDLDRFLATLKLHGLLQN